jgi:uncharacterized protein YhbP (UPF0306 family)
MQADFPWSSHIRACLDSTEYCCLATTDRKKVWANPVYFAYDHDISLYFYSQAHSLHMRNIEHGTALAVAIYSTEQSTHGDVCGIQMEVTAERISDLTSVTAAYDCYFGRVFPDTRMNPDKEPRDYLGSNAEWQFVKMTPKEIWYFDTRYFAEERVQVPVGVRV